MLSKSFIRRGVGMVAIEYAFAVINFSARESNTNPNPNYNYMTHTQSQKQHRHFKSRSGHGRHVDKIQQIIHTRTNGYDGWEKCWEEEVTPWDLGKPTPIIEHLVHTHALPNGRALVPGCGSGYDVVAMASPDRYVIGLEISQIAIDKALQISSSSPNSSYFTFLKEDFFTWRPTELFDLIFDYTFFCAIEPERRSAWAEQINNLLKPDGELITLMFPIGDHSGGPPYKISILDYEDVLCPFGFKAISISDNDLAVEPRKVTYSISLCLFMERGSLKGFLNYTSSWLKLPLTYLSTSLLKLDMLKREGRSLGGGRGCLTNQLYETPLYVLWNKGDTYEIAIIWIGKLIYTSYGLALCTEYICQVVNNKVRRVLINNVAEAHMATGMITILLWGALVSFSLLM